MNPVEYIGLAGSLFIMASMCFPTNTKKTTIMLRVLNLIGSAVFLVYGILLPAISTAVLNGVNVVVNTVQLVLVLRKKPEDEAKKEDDKEQSESNVTCDESSGEQKDAE